MNINIISNLITIKNSPFYKSEILRPFIDAYTLKPNIVGDDKRCVLLNKYKFGSEALSFIEEPNNYNRSHFDIFIGYRFLNRKYRPFYLSISKHDEKEFEICGFSTIMDNDFKRDYYETFTMLPNFIDWNFNLILCNDTITGGRDSLFNNLKKISEKTLKKNMKLAKKRGLLL